MNSGPVKAAEKLPKISKSLGLPRTNRSRVPNELVFAVGHFTTLQVFNHRTNRWFTHKKPAFPAKFKEHFFYGAAAVDGKLVAMGKHHAYSLDLSTHIWTKSSELNGTENCPGRATVSNRGKVYCISGSDWYHFDNGVDCFCPSQNEWTQVKPMNIAREYAAAVTYDNKIVVLGGRNLDDGANFRSVEIYNTESDEWTFGPDMIVPRACHTAVVQNNIIFVICGMTDGEGESKVEYLDLVDPSAIWRPASGPNLDCQFLRATVVNKKIMVANTEGSGHTEFYSEGNNKWTSQPINRKAAQLLYAQNFFVTAKGLPNRKSYT